MAKFQYGGQALIEGVMMRGPSTIAVAVRRDPHRIVVEKWLVKPFTTRHFLLRWPLVRGVVVLIESLVWGMKSLMLSANLAMEEEEEDIRPWEMLLSVLAAVALVLLLFVAVPVGAGYLFENQFSLFGQNLIEGIVRVVLFIGYVVVISRMQDIQRVFAYHGAEHQVIHAYEAGAELNPTAAKDYPTLHPRCGTSFLLVVLLVSILVFSLVGVSDWWDRLISRLILLPVVAGLSYEIIKLSARPQAPRWLRAFTVPGLWLQKLTTRQPDSDQLEVAVKALEAVLPEKVEQEMEGGGQDCLTDYVKSNSVMKN